MECFLATLAFVAFVIISAVSEQRRRTREIHRDLRVYNQPAPGGPVRQDLGDRRYRDMRSSFRTFAAQVDGQLATGKFTGSPRVLFNRKGARGMLSLHDTEQSAANLQTEGVRFSTRLTVKVPRTWPLRLELFPQDRTIDAKYLRMYDLQIGVPEFDARYVIKGSDLDLTREFLAEPVRRAVDDLYDMPPFVGVVISLNRERLIVSKPSVVQDPDLLRRFADAAFRLHDRIEQMLDRLSGMEIVVGAPAGDELPVCNVCGADIGGGPDRVECRRCATPLHRGCWEYNGKCAVYGCGEERYAG